MLAACISGAEVYTPRSPRKNQYYRCVEAHFEELDCGDLHQGFARVRCDTCHHEYLLPFSCKKRHFCPSCHQKRVVEFGEFLYEDVLESVPHRQWVFSLPKRLRPYFLYDRSLLAKLSQCAWKVLSCYLEHGVSLENPKPAAVIAVHLHIIATDGCFGKDGSFMTGIVPDASHLEPLFRLEVLMPSLKIWIHGITVGSMYFAGMPSGLMMRMALNGWHNM